MSERGCVVDAVAGHGDDSSLLLQLLDDLGFSFGQDFGFEIIDAELLGDSGGDGLAVSGEHHDFEPHGMQSGNSGARRRLERIGNRNESRQATIDGDVYECLAFGR